MGCENSKDDPRDHRAPHGSGGRGHGSGGHGAPPPPAPDPALQTKGTIKKPCMYFMAGHCREGNNCEYLHDESAAAAPPAATATPPAATARAPAASARPPPPATTTTDSSISDSRRRHRPTVQVHCRYFMAGNCRDGDNCPMIHFTDASENDTIISSVHSRGGGRHRDDPGAPSPDEADQIFRAMMESAIDASRNEFQEMNLEQMGRDSSIIMNNATELEDEEEGRRIAEEAERARQNAHRWAHPVAPLGAPAASPGGAPPIAPLGGAPLAPVGGGDVYGGVEPGGDIVDSFPHLTFDPVMHKAKSFIPEDKEGCPICFVPYAKGDDVMVLPCKHWYHAKCIKGWLAKHDLCPMCRMNVRNPGEEGR